MKATLVKTISAFGTYHIPGEEIDVLRYFTEPSRDGMCGRTLLFAVSAKEPRTFVVFPDEVTFNAPPATLM